MQCLSCHAENPAHARFCLQCGSPLRDQGMPGETAGSDEAERRQLTCLFCDLVNSVQLSERLDPEELRETIAAYRRVCASVVRRFGGHMHDYSGDGVMVYFGYPTAHEDDANRAVRSGLGIVEAVGKLSARAKAERGSNSTSASASTPDSSSRAASPLATARTPWSPSESPPTSPHASRRWLRPTPS